MEKLISKSVNQTEEIGENLGKKLKKGDVVAFFGELGAGKTAMVRGIARAFGCEDQVSSPTFALVHEYTGTQPLFHFDMYRIESFEDLYSTGFFDYLGRGIMLIEWSENIVSHLPENSIKVTIKSLLENMPEALQDEIREIVIERGLSDENTCV